MISLHPSPRKIKPDVIGKKRTLVRPPHVATIIASLVVLSCSAPTSKTPAQASGAASEHGNSHRKQIPDHWYEKAGPLCSMLLKSLPSEEPGAGGKIVPPPFDPQDLTAASAYFDALKAKGCEVLMLDNPTEVAGRVYAHLATTDHYKVAPDIGSLDNFRQLVRLAHSKGLPVLVDYNLGYASLEAPHFLKACDDVRAGRDTAESRWFLWADRADAPPPVIDKNTFFFVRPTHLPGGEPGTFYDSTKAEVWEYSERAGRYFWSKWSGNVDGKVVRLPQYNWNSEEFQQEAEKITRFWMDTGIDGMQQDAVNWYVGYTWEKGRRRMADVIRRYGNSYFQPEGAGAFREDPVAWITEGGWNSVQDYSLAIWWEKNSDLILNAMHGGDVRAIERAQRDYHDRVVAAGGVLWKFVPPRAANLEIPKYRLLLATVIALGNLVPTEGSGMLDDEEVRSLFAMKRAHPALHQLSTRRLIPTNADEKYYAFLRTAADASERVLVVLNFQSSPQTVEVDLSGVATSGLVELSTGAASTRAIPFRIEMPAYGYRFYQVKSAAD